MCYLILRQRALLIFTLSLMLVCSKTYANDELSDGPGVFTGKKGEFSLSQLTASKKIESPKSSISGEEKPQEKDVSGVENEFELFKLWSHSKTEFTADYQEFLLWLKYQQYLKNN